MAFVCWAAAAACAVFWGLKLFARGAPAPAQAVLASGPAQPRAEWSRLLGADVVPAVAAAPPPSSRFHLLGVVAPRGAPTAGGLALIAVDDGQPKAVRVGAVVEGDTVLQSVHARGASLGPRDGPETVSLDLPPPAPAATGVPGGAPPAARPMTRAMPPRPLALPGGLPTPRPNALVRPMPPLQPGARPNAGDANDDDRADGAVTQ